jgi:hypothetical protein
MSHARRLRFAVQLVGAPDGAAWAALVRQAEDSGFDVISLPDHLGEQFAPLPALTAAACATTRLRLSMFVLANDMRHPGVLAKEVATLDVLSGGRVELGLGAGWDEGEYRALGLPFDRPPVRIARLEESVRAIRALLAGDVVTHHGSHYQLSDLVVRPRPVQPGGVPQDALLGRSPGGHRQRGHDERRTHRPRCSRAMGHPGRRGGPDRLGEGVCGRSFRPARAQPARASGRRRHRSRGARGIRRRRDGLHGCGPVGFAVLGLSYFTISQRHMEQMAPVVARVVGR